MKFFDNAPAITIEFVMPLAAILINQSVTILVFGQIHLWEGGILKDKSNPGGFVYQLIPIRQYLGIPHFSVF
jgi:hypothetical protein